METNVGKPESHYFKRRMTNEDRFHDRGGETSERRRKKKLQDRETELKWRKSEGDEMKDKERKRDEERELKRGKK